MAELASSAASLPKASPGSADERLAFLETRRSVPIPMLEEPGPGEDELRRMLAIAARVPDHGALEPWRFIVVAGDARRDLGSRLAPVFLAENETMEPEQRARFSNVIARVFAQAPLAVIVVSRPDPTARFPVWEQELSAGAVCLNLLHAAHALGFAGSWLTGWVAYSEGARGVLGLGHGERIAGILPIGTGKETPPDRKRPDLDAITAQWRAEPSGIA